MILLSKEVVDIFLPQPMTSLEAPLEANIVNDMFTRIIIVIDKLDACMTITSNNTHSLLLMKFQMCLYYHECSMDNHRNIIATIAIAS